MIELAGRLPGELRVRKGRARDYDEVGRFHYRGGRPATFAGVWVVEHVVEGQGARVVAVGVLSFPIPALGARDRALNLGQMSPRAKLAWVNRNVRTISRVVVHPTFRGVGLAKGLVCRILDDCPTRYVEALAVMGRVHPFFEAAGMRRWAAEGRGPNYYLFDRAERRGPVPASRGRPLAAPWTGTIL